MIEIILISSLSVLVVILGFTTFNLMRKNEKQEDILTSYMEYLDQVSKTIEFSDEDSYKEKLQTVRESYFGTTEVKTENVLTEEGSTETPVETSGTMAQYMSAIGKDVKRSKK